MVKIPNLSEIKDLAPVEGGREYDLQITFAHEKKFNSGRYGLQLVLHVCNEDNAEPIYHNLFYGNYGSFQSDDEEQSIKHYRKLKKFLTSIGFESTENSDIDTADLIGTQFTAILEVDDGKEYDDDGNLVKDWGVKNVLGRITG